MCYLFKVSWSWSHSSWIYSYLCNQFLSHNYIIVRSNLDHCELNSIQHYVIKFVSELRQVRGFLSVLHFPPPIKLTALESGIKHHNPLRHLSSLSSSTIRSELRQYFQKSISTFCFCFCFLYKLPRSCTYLKGKLNVPKRNSDYLICIFNWYD